MLYSNGKVITSEENNHEELFEVATKLERWFELERGLVTDFSISEEHGYPMVVIPEGIEYTDVEICLKPNIQLKSFNGESIKLQAKNNVEIKHIFDIEEMSTLRDELAKNVLESEAQKSRKAQIVKQYNAKIEELTEKVSEIAHLINQGYEYRNVDCEVVLDFESKKRLYVDENGVVAKSEDLRQSDLQLQLFVGVNEGNVENMGDPFDVLESDSNHVEDDEPFV